MLLVHRYYSQMASMASSFVSSSGRRYIRGKVLKANTVRPNLNICIAHYDGQPFVLKGMSKRVLALSKGLKCEFEGNTRFRFHVDENEAEQILVYEYFKDDLLALITKHRNISIASKKWILREVGEALKDFHAKGWIDIDVKPDNVFVDWSHDEQGHVRPERVALGDLDCALRLEDGGYIRILNGGRLGNVMWSSPEQLTGQGIGKPSDVFAFGLMCLFVITSQEHLHPDFKYLDSEGVEHTEALMGLLIAFFGPLPQELVAHVNDEIWGEKMKKISENIDSEGLNWRFEDWKEEEYPELDPDTKRIISSTTKLDPAKRPTMEEIMTESWWSE